MNAKGASKGWLTVIAIVALAGLMAGCASVPPASPALKERALGFKPPPDEGAVYIICPKYFMGGCARWDVSLDGQKSSALKTGSFLYTPVWPGEHVVMKPNDDPPTDIILVVNEGQNSFVTVGPSFSRTKFKLLTAEAGENYVRNYEMSGDDFYQIPFLPGTIDSNTPVACHVALAQDDPYVTAQVDQPIDHPFFIALVDAMGFSDMANNKYAARAKEMGLPLQGQGLGQSFRTGFQASLVAAVDRSPWFHAASVDMSREYTNVSAVEINRHPVMQINLVYYLSPDASSLIMRAELVYFRQGETNVTYDGFYTYVSEPLHVENNKAITQWSAANETLLRQRMDEGMGELITMMDIDFFHREQMNPDKRSVEISYYWPFYERLIDYSGFVMRDEGPRIIVQSQPGYLLSVAPNVSP
jgi:hypothetical protein